MNDEREFERRLQSRPLPAPAPALRERVLRSVAEELQQSSSSRRPWGLAVAACLLLSLALNVAASMVVERRIARYLAVDGLRPDEIAEVAQGGAFPADSMVEGLAHSPWLRRLASQRRRPSLDDYRAYLSALTTGGHSDDVAPHSVP